MSTDQADLSVTVLIWVRCFVMAPNLWEEQWWFRASWEHVSTWLQCGNRSPFQSWARQSLKVKCEQPSSGPCLLGELGCWHSFWCCCIISRSVLSRIELECSSQGCPLYCTGCGFWWIADTGLLFCCRSVLSLSGDCNLFLLMTFQSSRPQTVPPTFKMPSSFSCLCCRSRSSRAKQSHPGVSRQPRAPWQSTEGQRGVYLRSWRPRNPTFFREALQSERDIAECVKSRQEYSSQGCRLPGL